LHFHIRTRTFRAAGFIPPAVYGRVYELLGIVIPDAEI
jgi:hypothetical protein